MAKFEDNFELMSHETFDSYVTDLSNQIEKFCIKNKIKIDYVVPILRSGAVPAVYIANDLNIVKFAPIQIKKLKQENKYAHITLSSSLDGLDKSRPLTLLVVEGTVTSGGTLDAALLEIKQTLPDAKVLLACVCVRNKKLLPKNTIRNFYACEIKDKLFVYPWENLNQKEEHADQKIENIFF